MARKLDEIEPALKHIQDGIKVTEPVRAVPRMPEMIFHADTPENMREEIINYIKHRRSILFKTLTLCSEGPLRLSVDRQISLVDSIIDDITRGDIVSRV